MNVALALARKGFAVGAADAELLPFGKGGTTLHGVEAGWHDHLEAPGQAVLPFELLQIVSDRAEHIRDVGPDIGMAIAGKVGGIIDIARRHELGLAHGAGP